MKAMILAAGKGERMRPLTDATPKPLLSVGGRPLIDYHLRRLQQAGVVSVVINIAYLGEQIRDYVGNGERWGLAVQFSSEPEPLETAGALNFALDALGDAPFLLVNADIWTDFPFPSLLQAAVAHPGHYHGHLVLVPNPPHNAKGDFSLSSAADGVPVMDLPSPRSGELITALAGEGWTFSGISWMHPTMIRDYPRRRRKFALLEVLRYWMERRKISGEVYQGHWYDIGTPERLAQLDQILIAGELPSRHSV